ncbi:MAG: amidase [Proteobacteria bacterium]|nr:amidase [Pseudomonadota bacterium]
MSGLENLTISEAAGRIKRKEISPVELTKALLARIEGLEKRLHAFIRVTPDQALRAARAAEKEVMAGRWRGPMHGIPYGLKDIFDTAGIPTTGHSKVAMTRVPKEDATTVKRLKAAGGVLMGKLSTHEFAFGGPSFDLPWPPARNPWDVSRFTGGSSSGSGAAVAAGLVLGALGSDTGGSIRHPSAQCGIAGLKPTYGRVSKKGVLPLSFSLDNVGPMAWTARDNAILLGTIAGYDPEDPSTVDRPVPNYLRALTGNIKGLKVGLVRHFYDGDIKVQEEVRQGVETGAKTLASLGAKVDEVRLSPLHDYTAACWVILASEAYAVHEENLRSRLYDYGANFRFRILCGSLFSAVDYVQAQRARRALTVEMGKMLEKYDVLLTATVPVTAPKIREVTLVSAVAARPITSTFNTTGFPALAMCCGFTPAGLPLSMTLVGKPWDEAMVYRVADAYERATPWRERRPKLRVR